MKTLMAFALLTLSTFSFADTCFKAKSAIPAQYQEQIPQVICVYEYGVELSREVFIESSLGSLKGYYNGSVASARKEIYNDSVVCGEHLDHELHVSFKLNPQGVALEESLKVQVKTTSGFDGCHSNLDTEIFEFSKI